MPKVIAIDSASGGGEGSGEPQSPWAGDIDAAGHSISDLFRINGVKVYRALISQSNEDAPVATVLENSFGSALVWSRDDVGVYSVSLLNAFTNNKTFYRINLINYTAPDVSIAHIGITKPTESSISVTSADGTFTPADSVLQAAIEILVYP